MSYNISIIGAPPSPPLSEDERPSQCDSLSRIQRPSLERAMGDSELSYFLPSRQNGVNDMYLHIGLQAPENLVAYDRVCTVWAILRHRHPLLAAHVVMHDYDDVRFVYVAPQTPKEVIEDAAQNLEFRSQSKDDMIDTYLNGPRTLSNQRLSYLVIANSQHMFNELPTPASSPINTDAERSFDYLPAAKGRVCEYDFMICAAHFLGDGMALHNFANDFFELLGSSQSTIQLKDLLRLEWSHKWASGVHKAGCLPATVEDYLPIIDGKFKLVAARVDFKNSQEKIVGGHVFPRRKDEERHTVVPTTSLNEKQTKQILQKCKSKGVSISNALFALCNIAWIRLNQSRPELPILMYSALNLRPYLSPSSVDSSYWFLAVGYFNVMLPNFLLRDSLHGKSSAEAAEQTFWHRARSAKMQGIAAAKHPMFVSRTVLMAQERGQRARDWAKEDDEKTKGTWNPPMQAPQKFCLFEREKAPSSALIGLSLLGNLDGIYKHKTYGDIKLHSLTTGSRQRHGAMLLFSYTFAGRLWVSLGYDEKGLEREVVDRFWEELLKGLNEFFIH